MSVFRELDPVSDTLAMLHSRSTPSSPSGDHAHCFFLHCLFEAREYDAFAFVASQTSLEACDKPYWESDAPIWHEMPGLQERLAEMFEKHQVGFEATFGSIFHGKNVVKLS